MRSTRSATSGEDVLFEEKPDQDCRYESFLRLFSRDRDRIYAHVFAMVPHAADAEDVFQRCSIVLWRKFDEFDQSGSFLAWAGGIAVNEVRNFLKTRRRSRVMFFPEPIELLTRERLAAEDEFSAREAALRGCIEQLSPGDRQLLKIAYWEDQSLKEFSEATGGSIQVLYNRLSRIRKSLFACIERKVRRESPHE